MLKLYKNITGVINGQIYKFKKYPKFIYLLVFLFFYIYVQFS